MEVLNTGEELGRQILEDARKKASRMLEAADKERGTTVLSNAVVTLR